MTYPGWAADVHADEIPALVGGTFLVRAVEPADQHVRIRTCGDQLHFPARFKSLCKIQRADAIGIITICAASPETAADFASRFATGVLGLCAVTEIVRARQVAILE